MTIAKTGSESSTAGNGSTVAFSFPYRFFVDTDLKVYVVVDSTNISTLQTLTTHYAIVNTGTEAGGTITMVTPPASGETLLIQRSIPKTQGTDYAANDAFPAETHEAALDRLTLLTQGNERGHITFPNGDEAASILDSASSRASRIQGYDASGNLLTYSVTPIFTVGDVLVYDTVATLQASTEASRGTGAIWEGGGFRYIEVASGGDITNSAGTPVELDVLPDAGGRYNMLAWGVIASATDNFTKFQAAADSGYPLYLPFNVLPYKTSPITIPVGFDLHTDENTWVQQVPHATNDILFDWLGDGSDTQEGVTITGYPILDANHAAVVAAFPSNIARCLQGGQLSFCKLHVQLHNSSTHGMNLAQNTPAGQFGGHEVKVRTKNLGLKSPGYCVYLRCDNSHVTFEKIEGTYQIAGVSEANDDDTASGNTFDFSRTILESTPTLNATGVQYASLVRLEATQSTGAAGEIVGTQIFLPPVLSASEGVGIYCQNDDDTRIFGNGSLITGTDKAALAFIGSQGFYAEGVDMKDCGATGATGKKALVYAEASGYQESVGRLARCTGFNVTNKGVALLDSSNVQLEDCDLQGDGGNYDFTTTAVTAGSSVLPRLNTRPLIAATNGADRTNVGILSLNTELIDRGSDYNTSFKFIAPHGGTYKAIFRATTQTAANTVDVSIVKEISTVSSTAAYGKEVSVANGEAQVTLTWMGRLEETDKLWCEQASGSIKAGEAYTLFTVEQL